MNLSIAVLFLFIWLATGPGLSLLQDGSEVIMLFAEEKADYNGLTGKFPWNLPQMSESMGEQKNETGWEQVKLHRPGPVHRHGRGVLTGKLGARGEAVLSTVL